MNATRISEQDAQGLAHGRVPGRSDLNALADLLTEYRSAAIGSAPRPSAALAARLDLSATPIAMRRDEDEAASGVGVRRAASGLFGLGVTAAIIFATASGAAAVVGAGSAGLLPPGAQDAFDQVVSTIVPPGVAGTETDEQQEEPGDTVGGVIAPPTSVAPSATPVPVTPVAPTGDVKPDDSGTKSGNGNSDNENGKSGEDHGNSGNGNSGQGNGKSGEDHGNPGNGNGNGNGNSGSGNSGNGNGNGNSGNGNGKGN